MRLLNLFDGIGGFGLAAKWMGWTNVASCEIVPQVAYQIYRAIEDYENRTH